MPKEYIPIVLFIPRNTRIFLLRFDTELSGKHFHSAIKKIFEGAGVPVKHTIKTTYRGEPVIAYEFANNLDDSEIEDVLQTQHIPYQIDMLYSIGT